MLYGVTCKISNNTSTAMDNQSSYIQYLIFISLFCWDIRGDMNTKYV